MALEQLGNLPFFKFESQVMQIHSVSSALLKPVRLDSTTSGEHTLYLFTSHFTTELLYQSWLQQVHTYSGTCAMFLWEIFIIEIALHLFFVVSAHHCFMLIVTHLAAHEKKCFSDCFCFSFEISISLMCWGLFSFHILATCLLISLMCSAFSAFRLLAVCLLISFVCCGFSAFCFLTVCLLITLMCSGFSAFCFLTDCLLISLMCSGLFAFHFLMVY